LVRDKRGKVPFINSLRFPFSKRRAIKREGSLNKLLPSDICIYWRGVKMRITSGLMNGGLIGFGLGFIAASIALQRLVIDHLPSYTSQWYFQGVFVVGGIGMAIGIGFEVYERIKMKKQGEEE